MEFPKKYNMLKKEVIGTIKFKKPSTCALTFCYCFDLIKGLCDKHFTKWFYADTTNRQKYLRVEV
jgi:hypothetical protein